jgi:divalent metal cation (Fe/Co/Zn/Cd) transporter
MTAIRFSNRIERVRILYAHLIFNMAHTISTASITTPEDERTRLVKRGVRLEFLTVGWNSLEALTSIVAGTIAGSIALVGFGFDSLIEVSSALVLLWRLGGDARRDRREQIERRALRLVGVSFMLLAAWVLFDAVKSLINREAPEASVAGILIAALSLIVMPILARAKRRVAAQIESNALRADARQTDICAYLSAILLGGLLLNAFYGWWWADPVAALVMFPIIAREGIEALRGQSCGCASHSCG